MNLRQGFSDAHLHFLLKVSAFSLVFFVSSLPSAPLFPLLAVLGMREDGSRCEPIENWQIWSRRLNGRQTSPPSTQISFCCDLMGSRGWASWRWGRIQGGMVWRYHRIIIIGWRPILCWVPGRRGASLPWEWDSLLVRGKRTRSNRHRWWIVTGDSDVKRMGVWEWKGWKRFRPGQILEKVPIKADM